MKVLSMDLTYNPYSPKRKEWIASAVGAALSLGSQIYGGIKSAEAEQEARAKEEAQHARNEAYFNRRYNESYADTAAGRNLLRQARDYADDNWKKAQGAAALGGGSDAATAMAKEAGNKVVADTLSNMASMDTARKDAVDAQRFNEANQHTAREAASLRQQGVNVANAASAMGNAAMSVGNAVDSYVGSTPAKVTDSPNLNAGVTEQSGINSAVRSTGISDMNRDEILKGLDGKPKPIIIK